MRQRALLFVVAWILPHCFAILSLAQETGVGPLHLEVHFHNYVSAPPWLLRGAAAIAEDVYRSANIEIRWIDCTAALEGKAAPASCSEAVRPTTLVVQLPTKRMVKSVPTRKMVFGYAVPAGEGEFARRASLFYHRIQSYSTAEGSSAKALLGMALAHEIGHLLLGRNGHSAKGLMSCPWSKADIAEAARGRLTFGLVQLAEIREQVSVRVEADRLAAAD